MHSKEAGRLSLISIKKSEGLKYQSLRELTLEEDLLINSMAEPCKSLENVADVVWMFKSAVKAWHDGVHDALKSKNGGKDHLPEINLKTINVLSAFFVLDHYFTSALKEFLNRKMISTDDSKRWKDAPANVKAIIERARRVRGTLHYTLPVKSYRKFSTNEETTFTALLYAHSGREDSSRGTSDESVCAVEFMLSLEDMTAYASSLWAGLIPQVLSSFDSLCKRLDAEVSKAGGETMTVGHVIIEEGKLNLSYLDVSSSPIQQLLDRLNK